MGEDEGNGDGTGGRDSEADGMEVRRVSTVVWRPLQLSWEGVDDAEQEGHLSNSGWLSERRHGGVVHGEEAEGVARVENNGFVGEICGKDLEFFCEGRVYRAKMKKVGMGIERGKVALVLWKEINGEAKIDGGGR